MSKVPDCLFPSEPRYGIPVLDLDRQANYLELPFRGWGQIPRRSKFPGTWHFYTYDYKFAALWKKPDTLVQTNCLAAAEVNYSTNDQMSRALMLADLYRKRWLARYWQSKGIRIWADLNVCDQMLDVALLGVPEGWQAYSVRAADYELEALKRRALLASEHSNRQYSLVVYGGGLKTRKLCADQGWVYVADKDQRSMSWEAADAAQGALPEVKVPADQVNPQP